MTADDLADTTRRALADHSAGVRDRADDWLTLKL